jgi:hypothetical protein
VLSALLSAVSAPILPVPPVAIATLSSSSPIVSQMYEPTSTQLEHSIRNNEIGSVTKSVVVAIVLRWPVRVVWKDTGRWSGIPGFYCARR